eukprot:TRINITY_DN8688_c0_g1_i2.p2 TRINITY_DN8688_c0_g1~~TRINITY_DN8688_c0_g1_i2.p2  ORF type:complete len:220 (-),score=76.71 TRINITY_DN8688_c0_g1_i2:68-727(-)
MAQGDGRLGKWGWLLQNERKPGKAEAAKGIAIPLLIVLTIALAAGLALNVAFTGKPMGKSAYIKVNDAVFGSADKQSKIELDACTAALMSTAMVIPCAFIRFLARFMTHPRVYGVYSFVVYALFLAVLLWQVFGGQLTVLTEHGASAFATQIYGFLGSNFNFENAKFATTWKDISQVSDFWNWMKGPFLSLIHISEPTRLLSISYAVFCLKKKKKNKKI